MLLLALDEKESPNGDDGCNYHRDRSDEAERREENCQPNPERREDPPPRPRYDAGQFEGDEKNCKESAESDGGPGVSVLRH